MTKHTQKNPDSAIHTILDIVREAEAHSYGLDVAGLERYEALRDGVLTVADCLTPSDSSLAALRFALSEPCHLILKVCDNIPIDMLQQEMHRLARLPRGHRRAELLKLWAQAPGHTRSARAVFRRVLAFFSRIGERGMTLREMEAGAIEAIHGVHEIRHRQWTQRVKKFFRKHSKSGTAKLERLQHAGVLEDEDIGQMVLDHVVMAITGDSHLPATDTVLEVFNLPGLNEGDATVEQVGDATDKLLSLMTGGNSIELQRLTNSILGSKVAQALGLYQDKGKQVPTVSHAGMEEFVVDPRDEGRTDDGLLATRRDNKWRRDFHKALESLPTDRKRKHLELRLQREREDLSPEEYNRLVEAELGMTPDAERQGWGRLQGVIRKGMSLEGGPNDVS